jgi:hypothetical protein
MNQRSDEFAGFQERVYARAATAYNFSFLPDEEVNVHVVGYYDALKLFMEILRETEEISKPQDDLSDGLRIARLMRNRTFRSVAGFKRLNENGDVDGNFLIKAYNRTSKDFEVNVQRVRQLNLSAGFSSLLLEAQRQT